jgi:WD40 repeat protein
MLVGNNNNTAHLWSIKGGKVKYSFTSHSDSVNTVGFFDTKKCFTGSSDSTLKLWDLNKGNLAVTFLCGTKCFSSATDGHLIYTGHNNGYIKFWSENKKTPVAEKKIHSGSISHLILSSDNNSLVNSDLQDLNIERNRNQYL